METDRAGAKPRVCAAWVLLLALAPGCRAPAEAPLPAWQAAIVARNRELEHEFSTGNLLGVADIYADDAVLVDARGQRACGRDELDAYWSGIEDPLAWRLELRELSGSEAIAYQLGTSQVSTRAGGMTRTSVSDILLVWCRAPDGAWRIEFAACWPGEER